MNFVLKILLLVICFGLFSVGFAQEKQKMFKDTSDGAFDISHYMYDLNGVTPLVSPITEPAVGYGGALAVIYFIPKKKDSTIKFQMPDIVSLAGGLTANNTWFVGGGYLGFWKKDHIRYRGVFGYGDVKLKYYGSGSGFLNQHPINFTIKSSFFLQQAIARVGDSKFLIGGKYQISKSEITLFSEESLKWIKPKEIEMLNSGVGIIGEYENLNNFLSPTKGARFNITHLQYSDKIGSDANFGISSSFLHCFLPVIKQKWISGFRLESNFATDDTPFYMNPFINLRGNPAMRYQGQLTGLIETEQLLLVTKRWGINAFAGLGRAYASSNDLDSYASTWNYGGGFRYLIAREMGLRMGIDIAKSPEDYGVYIVFGSAWIR